MTPAGGSRRSPVFTIRVGRLTGEPVPVRSPELFVLAGLDWQAPAQAHIELRARRRHGGWTPWVRASVLGHDSERGEAAAFGPVGEPVWTGPADALQLRSTVPVDGLNVHLVTEMAVRGDGDPAREGHELAHGGASTAASTAGALPLATPILEAGPGQPPIIARHAWAGRMLPRAAPFYGDVRLAFVHHSVNANGYGAGEVPAMLRSIYYFHTHVRGWNDIGYNFAVDAYGRTWECRAGGIDRPVVGAQAGGYNLESVGVVLLGDFASTLPSAAARGALAHLLAWKLALHGVPVTGRTTVEVDPADAYYTRYRGGQRVALPRIAGHRDGCTTDCPGDDMYFNGLPPLRRSVAQLVRRQVQLTLQVGPGPQAAYPVAPYPIAPGTRVRPARDLQLSTIRLTAGRELPLHGHLRSSGGSPLLAATIHLQELIGERASVRDTPLATALTGHDGLWVATLTPRSNLLVRALHAEAPAAVSALIVVGVAPVLALAVTPVGGGEVLVEGSVSPGKRHVMLEVVRATGAHRPELRRRVETAAGSFRHRLRIGSGRHWVIARTAADATNLAGASPRVAVHL